MPARRPPTGSTARSGRSSRSTRSCPAASTSSSSASRSASKLPSQPDLPSATRRWLVTLNATPDDSRLALAPLDEKADHVRGSPAGHLIIEYGDYECPYSRQAFHAIEQVERQLGGKMRFAFRHFPLTSIHPHALAAAAAAEAAALQGRFWDMHELLFHWQKALEDGDLRRYAAQLRLDVAAFDRDRASTAVADRIRRDVDSGLASGQVVGTPTLFIDGVVPAAATTRPPCWPRWPHEPPCPHAAQHQADPAGGHRRPLRRLPGDQLTVIRSRGAP